jgi:hypothetical protein
MRIRIIFWPVLIALLPSIAFAQSPAVPSGSSATPVQVKRVPAGQTTPAPNQTPSLVQKYDFGGQLRILQDPTAMDPQNFVGPVPSAPASKPETDGKVPNGFQPRTDLPLNSTALEAVRMSDTWRAGQNTPAAGSDGRVLYAYGAGLPIVVCAPLRVCRRENHG